MPRPPTHLDVLLLTNPPAGENRWHRTTTLADTLRRTRALRPRAVVVRIDTDRQPSLRILEELRRRWPRLPLIAVATHPDDALERHARAAGAHLYLPGLPTADHLEHLLNDLLPAPAPPPRPSQSTVPLATVLRRLPQPRAHDPPQPAPRDRSPPTSDPYPLPLPSLKPSHVNDPKPLSLEGEIS